MRIISLLAALLWLLAASVPAAAHEHGAKQQGVLSLDVYRDGGLLHVLTLEIDAGHTRRLLYRQSSDDGRTWTNAVHIDHASASIYDLTRGNDAQIAASGRRIVVLWTAKGSGYAGSGPLMSAVSNDGGKTWQRGGSPADDRSNAGQAYAELSASPSGMFNAVWLDARDGAQGLRHARSRDGVKWEKNTTVQGKTCECCWLSLAHSSDDLLALFRGKDPRDMRLSILRNSTATWMPKGPVGKFDWDFKGCPHTGGGLASVPGGRALHAVVWTGARGKQGLHHLLSRDGGDSWSAPQRLGSQDAQRADIAVSANGKTLAATWDQLAGANRQIFAALSRDQGGTWSAPDRLSAANSDAVYPRVVPAQNGFLVLWTERQPGTAMALRTARLPVH